MIDVRPGDWEGLERLSDDLLQELRAPAERAVTQAGVYLEGQVKLTLSGTRSGRAYRVSRTGELHIASAPGEPPAVLFGNLRNSIGHSDPMWDAMTVAVAVGPGLGQPPTPPAVDPDEAYARRLEWGGVDSRGVRILPRPYMEPSFQRSIAGIERILEAELR